MPGTAATAPDAVGSYVSQVAGRLRRRQGRTGSRKGPAAALPAHVRSTVGKPDIASVGLPNRAVSEAGYPTSPAHPKGKDLS